MTEYPLNAIEKDIRPEDFPEGSIWRDLVEHCGPASVVVLAKYKKYTSDKLTIRNYDNFVYGARKRKEAF